MENPYCSCKADTCSAALQKTLSNLKFIVIDEAHTYRGAQPKRWPAGRADRAAPVSLSAALVGVPGVFGSQMACVMRRPV